VLILEPSQTRGDGSGISTKAEGGGCLYVWCLMNAHWRLGIAELVAQFPGNNAARAQENLSRMKPTKIGQVFGERQLLVTQQLGERAASGGR
jgi:hypothetical protein